MFPEGSKRYLILLLIVIIIDSSSSLDLSGNYPRFQQRTNGTRYLNSKKPLWILNDQVAQASSYKWTDSKLKRPSFYLKRGLVGKSSSGPRTKQQMFYKKPIKIPNHYRPSKFSPRQNLAFLKQIGNPYQKTYYPIQKTNPRQRNDKAIKGDMPIFDSIPGQDTGETMPVFVFNGPKGEILVNTMLSGKRYPMREPVPGQKLYPPTTPMFKPEPIVEKANLPIPMAEVNLTLIPFYAHEAINPEQTTIKIFDESIEENLTTPPSSVTQNPEIVYSAPVSFMEKSKNDLEENSYKWKKQKKAKQYSVYRTPDEVHWLPPTFNPLDSSEEDLSTTTPFPLAIANPLETRDYETKPATPALTTSSPSRNSRHSYKDLRDLTDFKDLREQNEPKPFQITYVDEILEKPSSAPPTSTAKPKSSQTSRYTMSKEYFAFPVYTLGKLLKPLDSDKENEDKKSSELGSGEILRNRNDDVSNTWFVLNSRYKGHLKHNPNYSFSSKYFKTNQVKILKEA